MRTIRMHVCICAGEIALEHGCIYSHADSKIYNIDLSEFPIGKKFFSVCRFSSIYVHLSSKRISNQFYLHGKNFSKIAPRRYNTCYFFFKNVSKVNFLNFQNFSMRVSIIDSRFFSEISASQQKFYTRP